MDEKITIEFLGGSDEVGCSAMVLEILNHKLLLEYGMRPSKPPKYPLSAPLVDYILLSHAHLDHSGMIPAIAAENETPILTTEITGILSNILHKDSIMIAKMEGYAPPYSQSEIRIANHCIHHVESSQSYNINDDYEIRFHSAGHIPGSLMFEMIGSRRFLFTGDFNVIDSRLVTKANPIKCDILCMEGTYAGRDHPKAREELEKEFIDKIEEVIRRGGVVILPAFAVARSQEIALILKNSGFDIWFDGMGRKVAQYFMKYPRYMRSSDQLKRAIKNLHMVHSDHGRKLALKSEVILTSSGMMDGGPILTYMSKLKDNPKNAVILTGYQVENTNSRLLVDEHKLNFYGVVQEVACEVAYFDFSAHAGHSQLIEFAEACDPSKIILFHSDNREALVEPLSRFAEVYTPHDGEVIQI